jgi:hypothetical protein
VKRCTAAASLEHSMPMLERTTTSACEEKTRLAM